jgi:hypothetical protein
MPFDLLDPENRLSLDPKVVEFLRARTQGPAPVAPDPAVLPPPDPETMRLLEQQDAEAKDYNIRQDLKEGIGRSMNYFLGKPVNPDVGQPKVDDSMRKYLISRKMGAAQDPMTQQLHALDLKLKQKQLDAQPPAKVVPMSDGPATEQQRAELKAKGENPDAYPTMGYAQARLLSLSQVDAARAGRADTNAKEDKKDAKASESKRSLGVYLTPATADLTDNQRSTLMNELAVPGSQWLDQMAELSGVLDSAGTSPTPQQLADIHRLIASSLVKQNKVAGLGALSGPDMDLLKKAGGSVGDLTNFLGQATGLRDLKRSVRSAAERGAADISKAAGAYGSNVVPGSPLDFKGWDSTASGYAKKWGSAGVGAKRPTRTVGNETREWNGSAWVAPGSP